MADLLDETVTDDPKVEDPKVEDPKVEDPKAKVEDPKVEDPKVEDPKAEDPKVEDPKNDADLLSDDGDGDKEGVPEKYTFEPPEGVEVDETLQAQLDAFGETAREMGLSQAQYQALVEFDHQRAGDMTQAFADAYTTRIKEWRTEAVNDPELKETAAVRASALVAVNKFGTPELKALLASPSEENPTGMGIGNHPELVRFFHRIGLVLADPDLLLGDDVPEADGALRRMYPSMYPAEKT